MARKTSATSAKKHDSPIQIGKNVSRRRPGNMSDQGLKKKHHWMTPIEHFLIDIIHCIENRVQNLCQFLLLFELRKKSLILFTLVWYVMQDKKNDIIL